MPLTKKHSRLGQSATRKHPLLARSPGDILTPDSRHDDVPFARTVHPQSHGVRFRNENVVQPVMNVGMTRPVRCALPGNLARSACERGGAHLAEPNDPLQKKARHSATALPPAPSKTPRTSQRNALAVDDRRPGWLAVCPGSEPPAGVGGNDSRPVPAGAAVWKRSVLPGPAPQRPYPDSNSGPCLEVGGDATPTAR